MADNEQELEHTIFMILREWSVGDRILIAQDSYLKTISKEIKIKLKAMGYKSPEEYKWMADAVNSHIKRHYVKWDREKVEEVLQQNEITVYWEMPRAWKEATGKMGDDDSKRLADQLKEILTGEG